MSSATPTPLPTIIPTIEYEAADDSGHRTLWVVFVIQAISSLAFYVLAYRVPAQKRLFHVLTAFITTFAALSYYAMASGQGISYSTVTVKQSHDHGIPDTVKVVHREVYWARYVDWSITTPLLLADLGLLAGINGASLTVAIVADVIMILTGLFAGLTDDESTAWGWYAIACLAYLVIVYQLAINGRTTVSKKDSKTATFFTSIAGFTLVLWTVYPIIWGLADGSRTIGVDGEIIAYAVLDVLAKPVFGFWLLFTHDALPAASLTVDGFWSHGVSSEGGIRVGDDDEGA